MAVELFDYFLDDDTWGTVTFMNKYVSEFQFMERKNTTCPIVKLDANTYYNRSDKTKEVKTFQKKENRGQSYTGIKATLKRMGYKINANFEGAPNEFFITLTFKEPIFAYKKASRLCSNFIKRFKNHYSKYGNNRIFVVPEPHANGAWHFHMLVKFLDKRKFTIKNNFDYKRIGKKSTCNKEKLTWEEINYCKVNAPLFDIWGHGLVQIRRLKNIDNVSAYLTSYLTNISLDEIGVDYYQDKNGEFAFDSNLSKEEKDYQKSVLNEYMSGSKGLDWTKDKSKAVIKGARLRFYPRGIKMYRAINCVEPERFEMSYKVYRKHFNLKDENNTLRSSVRVYDAEKDFSCVIVKEQYNLRVSNTGSKNILYMRNLWNDWKKEYPDDKIAEQQLFIYESYCFLRNKERETILKMKTA